MEAAWRYNTESTPRLSEIAHSGAICRQPGRFRQTPHHDASQRLVMARMTGATNGKCFGVVEEVWERPIMDDIVRVWALIGAAADASPPKPEKFECGYAGG